MIKRRAAEQKGGKVLPYSSRSPRCNDSHEPKRLQQPETRRSAWVTIQPWLHHVLVASTTWLPLPWVAIPHRVLSEIPRPRIDFGGLATVPTKSPSAAARWSWALLRCWGTAWSARRTALMRRCQWDTWCSRGHTAALGVQMWSRGELPRPAYRSRKCTRPPEMGHRWKGLAETFKHENGLANPKMFITDQLVAFLENSEISMTQKSLQKKSQDVHQLHPFF